jgi:hypothetical protein
MSSGYREDPAIEAPKILGLAQLGPEFPGFAAWAVARDAVVQPVQWWL